MTVATQPTLGGVTLAWPTTFRDYELPVRRQVIRMYNGTAKETVAGSSKKGFDIGWGGLTEAQKDAIETRARTAGSQTLVTPENESYTVIAIEDSLTIDYKIWGNNEIEYTVSLTLEEV